MCVTNYEFKDRYLVGDPRYKSKLISKFINCLVHGGKKSIAQKIFFQALDIATALSKRVESSARPVPTWSFQNSTRYFLPSSSPQPASFAVRSAGVRPKRRHPSGTGVVPPRSLDQEL